jgi:hypothetical protein
MGTIVNSTFISLDGVINHMDRWPGRDGDYADRMNTVTKYVASATLQAPKWANTTVLNGDLAEAATGLKQATGRTVLMHGYGRSPRPSSVTASS